MKINIFGVGRSGTKAVQLYLSYLMAKKEGKVWLNYEPYFLVSRLKSINYYGIQKHYRDKQILRKNDTLPNDHLNYIKSLTRGKDNVITKFIRGNGRIDIINKLTEPDYTVLIIRDLYEVLSSVTLSNFNFCSLGTPYLSSSNRDSFSKVMKEAIEDDLVDDLKYKLKHINLKDNPSKNAFYWYVMNLKALSYDDGNTVWIDYSKLEDVRKFAGRIYSSDDIAELPPISDLNFKGDNIHQNKTIIDIEELNHPKWKKGLNQLFYLTENITGKRLPVFPIKVGGYVKEGALSKEKKTPPSKLKVRAEFEKCDLFDEFNNDIKSKLLEKKANNEKFL